MARACTHKRGADGSIKRRSVALLRVVRGVALPYNPAADGAQRRGVKHAVE